VFGCGVPLVGTQLVRQLAAVAAAGGSYGMTVESSVVGILVLLVLVTVVLVLSMVVNSGSVLAVAAAVMRTTAESKPWAALAISSSSPPWIEEDPTVFEQRHGPTVLVMTALEDSDHNTF
jgi:hypothetical protein